MKRYVQLKQKEKKLWHLCCESGLFIVCECGRPEPLPRSTHAQPNTYEAIIKPLLGHMKREFQSIPHSKFGRESQKERNRY